MISTIKTGDRLKELFKKNNLTVTAVAARLGISNAAVYKWLWGIALPSIDNIIALTRILNVKVEDIIVVED